MLERNVGMDLPMKWMREHVKNRYAPLPIKTTPYWTLINHYEGAKRKLYIRAYENIQKHGYVEGWARVKMFVKPDRIPLAEIDTKDARGIQARSPEFNLLYAHYLYAIERHIYELPGIGPTRITHFAKGKNNQQRAEHIQQKWRAFEDPIAFNIDHSRFDSTVSDKHLKFSHKIYKQYNKSRFFSYLMSKTINNKGYTKTGITYKIKGTRMSGDFDTGLGNSVINNFCLEYVFRNTRCEIYLDGDDSIVIMDKSDLKNFDVNDFTKLGFTTKIQPVTESHQIEFCQAKFLDTTPPYLARNPFRTMAHLNVSIRNYSKNVWPAYNEARYQCEMMMSRGLPIIPHICRAKLKNIAKFYDEDARWLRKFLIGTDSTFVEPTLHVRELYAQAWGINPEDQVILETENVDHVFLSRVKTRSKFKFQYATESLSTAWQTWHSLGQSSSSSCWYGGAGGL